MQERALHEEKKSGKKWRKAIEDAERQIAEHRRLIRSLRSAIAAFEENIEKGEPWPDDKSQETDFLAKKGAGC